MGAEELKNQNFQGQGLEGLRAKTKNVFWKRNFIVADWPSVRTYPVNKVEKSANFLTLSGVDFVLNTHYKQRRVH